MSLSSVIGQGEIILRRGTPPMGYWFAVSSGEVIEDGGPLSLFAKKTIGSGQTFGEANIINRKSYTATYKARKRVTLIKVAGKGSEHVMYRSMKATELLKARLAKAKREQDAWVMEPNGVDYDDIDIDIEEQRKLDEEARRNGRGGTADPNFSCPYIPFVEDDNNEISQILPGAYLTQELRDSCIFREGQDSDSCDYSNLPSNFQFRSSGGNDEEKYGGGSNSFLTSELDHGCYNEKSGGCVVS
jgi:Cyclic nucleotide-binding domain